MKLFVFLLFVACSSAFPFPAVYYPYYNVDSIAVGQPTSPQAMVMSGYYNPAQGQQPYVAASNVKSSLAYGEKSTSSQKQTVEEDSKYNVIPSSDAATEQSLLSDEDSYDPLVPTTDAPTTDVPRVGVRVGKKYDDEEEDMKHDGRVPYAMFPMFFSGRSGPAGAGGPGGITAIANSYSTGRSGIASSHATAYGGNPDETRRH